MSEETEALERAAGAALAEGYAPAAGAWDSLMAPDGSVRPQWRPLLQELARGRPEDHARRIASARRMVQENGVTYNVYDEEGGQARPWELDIIPALMGTGEWAALEAGLIQRARLAEALLADLYGQQSVVRRGLLPPHLVEGSPQFLRPLAGLLPPRGVRLHLYAADLSRAPDGSWTVQAERLDAPGGAGYALENRVVVSQAFPELFRDCGVRRLAAFFAALRESLMGLTRVERPRAVLLTPGPYNEAYFEHSYLARYLGLTLVEGDDLAVRDETVYLKTLAGLERVDVIFRRMDSDFCDPLELRADSALGVPGLVEAARAGTVVIANALGAGLAEAPALAAFQPALCRGLLGETLRLQGLRTLWCGDPAARRAALAEPEGLVFRDAFDNRPPFARGSTARLGSELKGEERRRLAERMERRGALFVAQEPPPRATLPVLDGGRLAPRPATLRAFVAWTPGGWVAMPGGLTRVASDLGGRAVNLQTGGASKDTWVLDEGPADDFSLLRPRGQALRIRRLGDEAPSRAMDNLYWLGRYSERAENLVRILRAVVLRLGDDAAPEATATAADLARRLLVTQARVAEAAAAAAGEGHMAPLAAELQALIFDRHRTQGLQRLLVSVQRTAWAVRDRLSLDTWRSVLTLVTGEGAPSRDAQTATPDPAGARGYLDALVRRAAALSGLAAENLTRGRNWLFLDMGRRLERAVNGAWLLRQLLGEASPAEHDRFQLLLEVADSSLTYRSRYLNVFQAAPVIDLLLLDETNPRAVAFQVERLCELVGELPRANPVQALGRDRVLIQGLSDRLLRAQPDLLAQGSPGGRRVALVELLDAVEQGLPQLSDAVTDGYFRHSASRRAGFAPRREAV